MKRRNFIGSVGCSIAATSLSAGKIAAEGLGSEVTSQTTGSKKKGNHHSYRSLFPRLEKEIYLNAAGMMPLSNFSQSGLLKYQKLNQLGYRYGEGEYVSKMRKEIRGLFAALINAKESEVGFIENTKSGEQIALGAVDNIKPNGNIVASDLNFPPSLHNLVGLKKAGRDVRIVRAENWKTSLQKMKAAIDKNTAIVALTLVSNINGHIEDIAELAECAHKHNAIVYADIIQAAGIVSIDVQKLGIDIAACSSYKWLYGVHGAGFIYVKEQHQGTRIKDQRFPGFFKHNYVPWVDQPDPSKEAIPYREPVDATRYQAGHISYLGYCAAYEGLQFINKIGTEQLLAHSVKLNQRLNSKIDHQLYQCISPHVEESPIITFKFAANIDVKSKLKEANIIASVGQNRLRISPAIYNNESDIDYLVDTLNS